MMLGINGLENVPRHMQPDEAEALQRMARNVRERVGDKALACEVGAYHGFTTLVIAQEMPVWSIDLGGDLLHGAAEMTKAGLETWEPFIVRMLSRGLIPDRVKPICSTSDFLLSINEPLFDLILVDADHSYEWCLRDLRNTARLAKPGCIIAVHDFYPGRTMDEGYGVHQACETFLAEAPRWEDAGLVTTMQFYRNTEGS